MEQGGWIVTLFFNKNRQSSVRTKNCLFLLSKKCQAH